MTKEELKQQYTRDQETGCWLWHGPVHKHTGRPIVYYQGKQWYASRLLWELVNKRSIPPGYASTRQCNASTCVNPRHYTLEAKAKRLQPYQFTPAAGTNKIKEAVAVPYSTVPGLQDILHNAPVHENNTPVHET